MRIATRISTSPHLSIIRHHLHCIADRHAGLHLLLKTRECCSSRSEVSHVRSHCHGISDGSATAKAARPLPAPIPQAAPARPPHHQDQHQQQHAPLPGGLYLVSTPIGNLEDITLRALRVLRGASLVLAEDTRHTRKLLAAYDIRTPALSFHAHNEKQRLAAILQRLQGGEALALVSDAGTPTVSDPGAGLVAAAHAAGVAVVPIPGACAAITALVACGLPTDRFHFCGFLPPKQGARRAALSTLALLPATLVFYAPPHGLAAVLADMCAVLGPERRCCVARELTKLHEEFFRHTLEGALHEFSSQREPKGEICLVVEGAPAITNAALALDAALGMGTAASAAGTARGKTDADSVSSVGESSGAASSSGDPATDLRSRVREALLSGASVSVVARQLALQSGLSRSKLYKLALATEQELKQTLPQQQQGRHHQQQLDDL